MRYTVVWMDEAQDELAELWMQASNPAALNNAVMTIDRDLANDPELIGLEISEGLMKVIDSPIQVFYCIKKEDRLVEVSGVKTVP